MDPKAAAHLISAFPQAPTLTDEHRARLSRLTYILETGRAYNGIGDDNAQLYAESLRVILAVTKEQP